ncbi:MAG TPA: PVC-type heme-binding CxxCH protein, partial [Roseimicrobium sp.]|nr:PVC-type heme-binding CxxCH protein [Roseimicrobium sp.]
SPMGKPGTPEAQRTSVNVGIWRYHPVRESFEIVAEGTTNPWGMDWDEHGEAFFINTVIGHLWHVIPGAHYRRMFGDDRNPHVYEIIEQHADHVHWATNEVWTDVRKGVTDGTLAAGGGHAHTGLMIYQGGQWPAEWKGRLLTVNFHGKRLNVERLEREGGGFVGKHVKDEFLFGDSWFRGIDLIPAPDGGMFVSDWSDVGECHDHDGIHRTSGRIYKITYGESKPRTIGDLAKLSGAELAKLQLSENDWLARQSRRVLANRSQQSGPASVKDAHLALRALLKNGSNPVHRLRALWALHVSGGTTTESITALMSDRDEYVRAWAVRLATDDTSVAPGNVVLKEFTRLAASEPSALVRLALASALQRIPMTDRAPVAAKLLTHSEDSDDHNLPLMLWYGIEPLADAKEVSFEKLLADARIPRVQRLGARRLSEDIDTAPARVDALLAAISTATPVINRQALLDGIAEGLAGRRKAPRPAAWESVQKTLAAGANTALNARIRDLSALFGDGRALDELKLVALNPKADVSLRKAALQVLVESRAPDLRKVCEELLRVRDLSATAASGLALSSDPGVADLLLDEWSNLYGQERGPVMGVLVSRPAWAAKTLDAIQSGKLQRGNMSAFQARQIRAFHDDGLTLKLEKVWGPIRDESEKDRVAALAKWQPRFTQELLSKADLKNGWSVFQIVCASCHTLNGEGGTIGPDLTGAARDNIGYLLENILFPSAIVPDDYRLTTLTLKDGRVLDGVIRGRNTKVLRLQTVTEQTSLPLSEVVKEQTSALSLMPQGLLDALDVNQARDLIGYLMSKGTPAK